MIEVPAQSAIFGSSAGLGGRFVMTMTDHDVMAHLQQINGHDDNDLSPNDKLALKVAVTLIEKLNWYERREELVRDLVAGAPERDPWNGDDTGLRALIVWEHENQKP